MKILWIGIPLSLVSFACLTAGVFFMFAENIAVGTVLIVVGFAALGVITWLVVRRTKQVMAVLHAEMEKAK